MRDEAVTVIDQPLAERLVVVDLAVADEPDVARLVRERLTRRRREVDDRQPSMSKAARSAHQLAAVVRASMLQRRGHALDEPGRDLPAVQRDDTCDATHEGPPNRPRV